MLSNSNTRNPHPVNHTVLLVRSGKIADGRDLREPIDSNADGRPQYVYWLTRVRTRQMMPEGLVKSEHLSSFEPQLCR